MVDKKNVYRLSREHAKLTREAAAELLNVGPDRVVRIEEEYTPRPEEVLAMARVYKDQLLCNYYCTHECEIGKRYIQPMTYKELTQIVLETLSALNTCNNNKDRLIELAADGSITSTEQKEFRKLHENLKSLSKSIDALQIWVEDAILNGVMMEE